MTDQYMEIKIKELEKRIEALEQEPCEDCVSRQALMSAFPISDSYTLEDICKTINFMSPVTPQQRWIPVSERMPEEGGDYIVTEKVFRLDDREHKGGYNTIVEPVEYSNGKWQRASFFEVIAWMPLPEPYKAESEEGNDNSILRLR